MNFLGLKDRILQASSLVGFPLRLLLGAVVGLVAGPGYLGFLAEFAAYRYAIYFGCRPPFEGIPYLRATVAATSFALFALAAVAFLLLYAALRYFLLLLSLSKEHAWSIVGASFLFDLPDMSDTVKTLFEQAEAKLRAFPLPRILKSIAAASLIVGFIVSVVLTLAKDWKGPTTTKFWSVLACILSFVCFLVVVRPHFIYALAAVMATLIAICAPVAFFHAPTYGSLLRVVKYGGHLPVVVSLSAEDSVPEVTQHGMLILRTTDSLFIARHGSIHEIPTARVVSICYARSDQAQACGGSPALRMAIP